MRRMLFLAGTGTVLVCLLCGLELGAQQSSSSASDNTNLSASSPPAPGTVPRLIKFNGVVKDPTGKVPTGEVGLTFSLYELPEGGSPLWVETQSVLLDSLGRYTALLGANSPGGLPLDLFTAGKALWVGVQPQLPGQGEQPRVLLVAVPYSLKSSDADTLGGRPASAYMLSSNQSGVGDSGVTALVAPATALPSPDARGDPPSSFIVGEGTANYVPKFTRTYNIANSAIYSTAAGLVGIGNTNPAGTLDVSGGAFIRGTLQLPSTGAATKISGFSSNPLDLQASAFNSGMSAAVPQLFRWRAEPAGNNTASPSATLNLLFGSGASTPGETGLSIAGNGRLTFASGQTFPGVVTSVAAGSGLQASPNPITSTGTLSIPSSGVTNSMLQNSSLTVTAGNGLSGGGSVSLGSSTTLSVAAGGVTNGMLQNSSLTVTAGSGLSGGGSVSLGGSTTLRVATGGVTNAMLQNPSLAVTAGSGLTGGGAVSLGGSTMLGLDPNASASTGQFVGSTSPVVSGTNTANSSIGQLGTSEGGLPTGVYGSGTNYGVYGSGGTGVYGNGSAYGVYGETTIGAGVYGSSTSLTGVYGIGGFYGVFGQGGTYGVYSQGELGASGTKSAVVALPDNRVVELYAMESPENWFEDFGSGQLRDGVGEVALEPTFALAANTGSGYHVFLTPKGDCEGLYVTNETATGFQVRELRGGKSNVGFDYRIVAKRRGYENLRMDELETDAETVESIRATVQNRPAHRKLILHKPPEAHKAPLALPKAGTPPAAPAVVSPQPAEPPKRSALNQPPQR